MTQSRYAEALVLFEAHFGDALATGLGRLESACAPTSPGAAPSWRSRRTHASRPRPRWTPCDPNAISTTWP